MYMYIYIYIYILFVCSSCLLTPFENHFLKHTIIGSCTFAAQTAVGFTSVQFSEDYMNYNPP